MRQPGYYWIKLDGEWIIANWYPHGEKGHGSFWTTGDECDIEIDDNWTVEQRGIEEIDERRIERGEIDIEKRDELRLRMMTAIREFDRETIVTIFSELTIDQYTFKEVGALFLDAFKKPK